MERTANLDEYQQRLEARKIALGIVGRKFVMANSGASRTVSKRKLLAAIEANMETAED